MNFTFKDFSWNFFGFEDYALLSLALLVILFLLFEYFPGRNYFYSIQHLRKFIDRHLIPHLIQGSENKKRSLVRMAYISLIWILLVLALANPRWDFEEVEANKPNVNLVILLDISKSMDTKDEKPSRLERAKQEINDIVKKADMANIGIIAFANQAHIISPITDDKNAITYLLPSVTTNLVGVQGSNIEAGLKAANLLLKPQAGGVNYVLIMSDGGFENPAELKKMSKLIEDGKIISFGIGGSEGAPIPGDNGKYIKDGDKTVLTKLEKDNLIQLSGLENYVKGSYLDDDTQKVVKIITSRLAVAKTKTKLFRIWHDRFYIPLALAVLLLLPFFRRGAIFPVIIIMLLSATPAHAKSNAGKNKEKNIQEEQTEDEDVSNDDEEEESSNDVSENDTPLGSTPIPTQKIKSTLENAKSFFRNDDQQGKYLLESRQYDEAEGKFTEDYNKGVASFRAGDYPKAETYFLHSVPNNIDAEYDMGNAQLLQEKAQDAITTYESVLKKQPDNKDAKHNLEIAKKLLKNQKNQNDSKNSQKNPQDNKDNKSQDHQQQQQGNSQQSQSNQNSQNGSKDDQNSKQNQNQQQQNGKQSDQQNQDKQGQGGKDKQSQNGEPQGGKQQNPQQNNSLSGDEQKDNVNNNSQESDGNNNKKELDIQAKSILSKISSDPAKLMNMRFKYEESKDKQGEGTEGSSGKQNPRPW